jgi:hypothetical protein
MSFLRVAVISTALGGAAIAGVTHRQDGSEANANPAVAVPGVVSTASVPDNEFTTIENQDETMTLQVPRAWRDVSEGAWTYHGVNVGYFLEASTNIADFQAGRPAPGVFMGVFSGHDRRSVTSLLDTEKVDFNKRCKLTGRKAYKDQFYVGNVNDYAQCGGSKQRSMVSVVQSGDGSTVLLRVNIASDADVATANQIFASFQVLGNVDEHDHGHGE